MTFRARLLLIALLGLAAPAVAQDDALPEVFRKPSPETLAELRAIQDHTARVVDKVMPSVVCVRVGPAFGSGVIVTRDGYVLTAGHVSGIPDREVVIHLHNGIARGKTLGGDHGIDSGLIKITSAAPEGGWPYADMADSARARAGDWCLVCAHPGGFKAGRTPPVRLGRVLKATPSTLTTDCILVGGDSGGPLFDMHGKVLGVNSRIGVSLAQNMHVPVNPFRESWDKMARAEVWGSKLGGSPFPRGGLFLGMQTRPQAEGAIIVTVAPNSPADKAGLKVDDVITKLDDRALDAGTPLFRLFQNRKAGDRVVLEVVRGNETLRLKLEIGKRRS